VVDTPLALEIGMRFDRMEIQNRNTAMREFRDSLWQCMNPRDWQMLGDAKPEIWYLHGTRATWWW
jgi:hypothetical protein